MTVTIHKRLEKFSTKMFLWTAIVLTVLAAIYWFLQPVHSTPNSRKNVGDAPAVNMGKTPHYEPSVSGGKNLGEEVQTIASKRQKLSFESEPDLYAVANTAVNSNDPLDLYNGFIATMGCMDIAVDKDKYKAIATKENEDLRKAASLKLLTRCRGFIDNDYTANAELRNRITTKIKTLSDGYFAGVTHGAKASDSQIAHVITSGDWHSFLLMSSSIAPRTETYRRVSDNAKESILYLSAWMQVGCDLGRNCSSEGFTYLKNCAEHNQCTGSFENELKAGLSDSELERVKVYRQEIGQAFQSKNFRYFGLG
jgi:hypothetical protein